MRVATARFATLASSSCSRSGDGSNTFQDNSDSIASRGGSNAVHLSRFGTVSVPGKPP